MDPLCAGNWVGERGSSINPMRINPEEGGEMETVRDWRFEKLPIGHSWFRHCVVSLDFGVTVEF